MTLKKIVQARKLLKLQNKNLMHKQINNNRTYFFQVKKRKVNFFI